MSEEGEILVNQKQNDCFSPDLYLEENQYPILIIIGALAKG